MSDAANRATRVILLLLATGGFTAVWSGDRRPPATTGPADSQGAAAVTEHQAVKAAVGNALCGVPHRGSPPERHRGRSLQPITHLLDRDVPLPFELSPGEYRVVNSRGEVGSMAFTPRDLACHDIRAACVHRDMYPVETGGERWYFIRIGRDDASPLAENSAARVDAESEAAFFAWHADTQSICPKHPARPDDAPHWEIARKIADWILAELPTRPRDARHAAKGRSPGYLFIRPFERPPTDRLRLSGR